MGIRVISGHRDGARGMFVNQSLLQFSERFLLRKLNNRHIETSRQEGRRSKAGGEKVDEYRANA